MKKVLFILMLALVSIGAEAQVHGRIVLGRGRAGRFGSGRFRGGYGNTQVRGGYGDKQGVVVKQRRELPPFQPSVNLSVGYGFPNLDKQYFANFSNLYKGNITNQTGPFAGALDYQFSRFMSIGVLGTYGKVSQPYFNYNNNSSSPDLTGNYENWSLMLNVMSYFATRSRTVSPYIRTAVGYNNWKQDYTNAEGIKTTGITPPSAFAYQASLGARFNLSPRAGLFVEGGYGKYIASAGMTFKF